MPATKAQKVTKQTFRENAKKDLSPKWDGCETWNGSKFTAHFREAMKYYNEHHSGKDLKPKVIDWMGRNDYSKSEIAAFKATKDWRTGITMGALATCLLRGMSKVHPGFNQGKDSTDWLRAEINTVLVSGKEDTLQEEKLALAKGVPLQAPTSIQDRIREQAVQMSEVIDTAIDTFIADPEAFDIKEFKMVSMLRGKGAKPAHVRYIRGFYESSLAELLELASGKADAQLKEAYSHLPRKHVKKLIEFLESVSTAADQISAESKVLRKPRVKKAKPAEELAKKLKFKVSDDKLGITSVPPATVIGAQVVIVLNTKTRKLGYYISKTSAGIGIKGTTLTNYSEKSMQRTLRKPVEQLKEFKDQNTQKRFETWFSKSVNTTETALTGRLNEDVVILKVYK